MILLRSFPCLTSHLTGGMAVVQRGGGTLLRPHSKSAADSGLSLGLLHPSVGPLLLPLTPNLGTSSEGQGLPGMEGAVCSRKEDATLPEVAGGWRQDAGGDSHSPDVWGFTQPPGISSSVSGCPTLALAPTHLAPPFTSG